MSTIFHLTREIMSDNEVVISGGLPCDELPRLFFLSGRTEEAVRNIISELPSKVIDEEEIGLLNEIYESDIPGHRYRGHLILKNLVVCSENVQKYTGEKRPIWFIFSGVGSQWPTMAKTLMILPKFAESIEKSHEILMSKGVDLKNIITDEDVNVFSDVLNTFVGIAAVQIALIDVLKCIGIQADGFIGHSAGEVACGYADDCLSSEEAILCAYYWGKSMKEGEGISGEMAAIGMGYKEVKSILPTGVAVGCHNSSSSCTVTGYPKAINDFVRTVSEQGILAQKINTSNIAIHSFRLYNIMPTLLENFRTVIKNPKSRSHRWISSTFPESKWNSKNAKLCCAEYLTYTMMNVVHFEEACSHIPSNAIAIEIAPHGLLQSILMESLNDNIINIPLTNRSHPDNLQFLLEALGRLFEAGVNQKISELYQEVEFL